MSGRATRVGSDDRASRLSSLRAGLRARGLSGALLVSPESVYYYAGIDHHGYFAFTALVIPVKGTPTIIAREMERPTMTTQASDVELRLYPDSGSPLTALQHVLHGCGAGPVGWEADTMWFPPGLVAGMLDATPAPTFSDISELLTELRSRRSGTEAAHSLVAAALTSRALAAGIQATQVGASEAHVAASMYAECIEGGGDPPGFPPLIRTQRNLFQEHVSWGDRCLSDGDVVFIEASGSHRRYHAPMSRQVYLGRCDPGVHESSEIAALGMDAVAAALEPGRPAEEVYDAWQRTINAALGHDRYVRHHCGYQVGIGFPPSWVGGGVVRGLRPGATWRVEDGMTFHVLSWLFRAGPANFVLSDTVQARPGGGLILTMAPRGPIVNNQRLERIP